MEAKSKKPVAGKLQKSPSRAGTKAIETPVEELTDAEKNAVKELKNIYLDTIKLDVELQHGIYKLEKDLEPKMHALYEKRAKLLSDFRKKSTSGDSKPPAGQVANFWLKVLKVSYTEFITPRDEKILAYLTDIRSKMYLDPENMFVIQFYFEPNEYFTNTMLTKTYYLNTMPNPEQPLTYDGAEIVRCEGSEINWTRKPVKNTNKNIICFSSFFDFFDPPSEPDECDMRFLEIKALLQNDFELGFYLKERVIPKAVLFFTGEIVDCLASDSESDDDDLDDENDEDDDEDDNDNDNDNDASSGNSNQDN